VQKAPPVISVVEESKSIRGVELNHYQLKTCTQQGLWSVDKTYHGMVIATDNQDGLWGAVAAAVRL
jgi:hypothetical protein